MDYGSDNEASGFVVVSTASARVWPKGDESHIDFAETTVATSMRPLGKTGRVDEPDGDTSGSNQKFDRIVPANRPFPQVSIPVSLEPIQEWEGVVSDIGTETFTARLTDLTNRVALQEEIGDLLIADVAEEDIALFRTGAVFRLVIGYQRRDFGQKTRASKIVFRRMPIWLKSELSAAADRAAAKLLEIPWD